MHFGILCKWPQNCLRTILDETLSQHVPVSKETGNEPRPSATTTLTRKLLEYTAAVSAHRFYSALNYAIVKRCAWCGRIQLRDDVMTWRRFSHYRPFMRGIHRWPTDYPHKGPVIKCFGISLISLNKLLSEVLCTGALRHHDEQVGHIIQPRTMKKAFLYHY